MALPPPLLRTPSPAPPTPSKQRDRASIGSHAENRSRLALERERDLGSPSGARGRPGPTSTPSPPGADRSTAGPDTKTAAETPRTESGRGAAGPGSGTTVQGQGTLPEARRGGGAPGTTSEAGQRSAAGGLDQQRSITRSLEEFNRRLGQMGEGGMTGAAGIQVGSLFFDPEGADFTGWINHFKNEVYRNWIVPEAARFGYARGHVDIEFWVERNGQIADLRVLKGSGTPSLDRAARNAITGSRLLPLPADYAPLRFRLQVTFYYGEERG